MGLLNSALQIGRSALLSYQGALQVVGSNISSAGSADYTRLTPRLDSIHGPPITGDLQPGAGVALTAIQRNIDESLEARLRLAIGAQQSASTQQEALVRMETFFDDLGQTGVGTRLTQFFNAFDALRNTPEDLASRDLVIGSGAALAESLSGLRAQLVMLSDDVNGRISALTVSADQIARRVAALNEEITRAEASAAAPATGLRDQRDAALRELSKLFDVTVREQPNGTVNVYVGNETLIQGNTVRGLVAVDELDGESIRTSIMFADTSQQVEVHGGELEGLLLSRDQHAQIAVLDQLAGAIIADVNRIHADGQGLAGFTSVTGTYEMAATDAPLDSAAAWVDNRAARPGNGSFFITVIDAELLTPVAHRIDVDLNGTSDGTTLESLVIDINEQVEGVTASITNQGRLNLVAADGLSFTFGYDGQEAHEDTSGVLAALGINTFFTGTDARTISVNETLTQQPSLLSAASIFLPGDGAIAGRIAELDTAVGDHLDSVSIPAFYRWVANAVALQTAAARDEVDSTSTVLTSLTVQRESISGVNLDEEAISLLKFQRAFQGASRFVSVVDDLLAELVALLR